MRIIAGPCQHETLTDSAMIAKECKRVCDKHGIEYYFKASFDKANRSSIKGIRGVGMDATLTDFEAIKEEFGVNTITDVHTVEQIDYITEAYNDVVDALQIPAFLCRQTDLVIACAKWFKHINVKKGQWLSPHAMEHVVTKIKEVNPKAKVYITERGTSFGYSGLMPDFRAVDIMKSFSDGVFLDCTHSTQKPKGETTGGDRELAKKYALAAKIFEYDGVFIETHPDPTNAISDADSQVELEWIVSQINNI